MVFTNEDVKAILAEIPEGHQHVRTTITLQDGRAFTFQEATIASLVRAYVSIKTHPETIRVELKGSLLNKRKKGYASWQLIEDRGVEG